MDCRYRFQKLKFIDYVRIAQGFFEIIVIALVQKGLSCPSRCGGNDIAICSGGHEFVSWANQIGLYVANNLIPLQCSLEQCRGAEMDPATP